MKAKILGLFALLTALTLSSCSSSELREKCPKSYAPENISGMRMEFYYTHAKGAFHNLTKQTLYTTFDKGSMTYTTKTQKGDIYASGSYAYLKSGPDHADLIFTSVEGPQFNKLNLKLHFTDSDEGKFRGELSEGAVGYQRGTFELDDC